MSKHVSLIDTYLKTDHSEFKRRAENQAESIMDSRSDFSPESHGIGIEREYYLADEELNLVGRSNRLCDIANCQSELGLHNVELASSPCSNFSKIGLFIDNLRQKYEDLAEAVDDGTVIRDGCVGLSPTNQSMTQYFSDGDYSNGHKIPRNMTDKPYYVILNHDLSQDSEKSLTHPRISYKRDGLMTLSLTTSIQPHIQVPDLNQLPDYFSASIRLCGPLTALSANSPYLPSDMYDSEPSTDPFIHENRITTQRDLFNNRGRKGMRLPKDIESFEELVNRIASHDLYMPLLSEDAPEVDWSEDSYEFNHQQRTTWWWVNPRIGNCATGSSDKAVRIELRPFSNQPTFKDNISLLLLSVGAVTGMVKTNHPALNLDWQSAYRNFREAEKQGSDASISWINSRGRDETDIGRIIEDIVEVAKTGLKEMGVPSSVTNRYLRLMSKRTESPSKWKCNRYDTHLAENDYESALNKTFREYVELSKSNQPFCEWS